MSPFGDQRSDIEQIHEVGQWMMKVQELRPRGLSGSWRPKTVVTFERRKSPRFLAIN
jgi:hypothetical protein